MEPLPKERSDLQVSGKVRTGVRAAMEPLPKERSDLDSRTIWPVGEFAAMEPLPKERSDGAPSPCHAYCATPQWSRSRRSGATEGTTRGNRYS